jgi:hypothetical protein
MDKALRQWLILERRPNDRAGQNGVGLNCILTPMPNRSEMNAVTSRSDHLR